MANIQRAILSWYDQNKRDLPWRTSKNPYFIWISEVVLQQTRVEQGAPFYHRLLTAFPTVESLARADEQLLF
jgi:A/G-specific adenine glycosylase